MANWRYVLVKEADRIKKRELNPTLLTIVEKKYPEGTTQKEILEEIKNRDLNWIEDHDDTKVYFTLTLFRIDLSKRYKNAWTIDRLLLLKKKDGGLKTKVSIEHGIYALETVAHTFGEKYWANREEDVYPEAGNITDPLWNNMEN